MGEKEYKPFDGAAWADRQVHRRTRAALTERGSQAGTNSREYKTEYKQQWKLFAAERTEIKRRKKEKQLARANKRLAAERARAEGVISI